MTEEIKTQAQQDQESVARLAALPCKTCEGYKGLINKDRGSTDIVVTPCPDCLDSQGQPTGRRFPGLSQPCHLAANYDCKGTGLVPVSVAEAVLELMQQPGFGYVLKHAGGFSVYIRSGEGVASTPIQALEKAIMATEAANA